MPTGVIEMTAYRQPHVTGGLAALPSCFRLAAKTTWETTRSQT
jgi:hypothetical protein